MWKFLRFQVTSVFVIGERNSQVKMGIFHSIRFSAWQSCLAGDIDSYLRNANPYPAQNLTTDLDQSTYSQGGSGWKYNVNL
jgi:hypothetical protein